jgi:hypothetical protein
MNIKIYKFLLPFVYSITSGMNNLPREVMGKIMPCLMPSETMALLATSTATSDLRMKFMTKEHLGILSALKMQSRQDVSDFVKTYDGSFESTIRKIFEKDQILGIDAIGKLNAFHGAQKLLYNCLCNLSVDKQANLIERLIENRGFHLYDFIVLLENSYEQCKNKVRIDVTQVSQLISREAMYKLMESFINDVIKGEYPEDMPAIQSNNCYYNKTDFALFLNHMHSDVRKYLFMRMTELDEERIAVAFVLSFFVQVHKGSLFSGFRSSGVVQFLRESNPNVAKKVFSSIFKQIETLKKCIHNSNKDKYGLFKKYDIVSRYEGNLFNMAALNTCFAKPGYEHIREEILQEIKKIIPNLEDKLADKEELSLLERRG